VCLRCSRLGNVRGKAEGLSRLSRGLLAFTACLALVEGSAAQTPPGVEALELARSRECVDVLTRLEALDRLLAPLAARSQRLLAIAEAVALEDPEALGSFDTSDALEAEVQAWFTADAELARRNVDQPSPELQNERNAARERVRASIAAALDAVQAEADATLEATGDLGERAPRCDGAILVRSAVLEACGSGASVVCSAARDTVQTGPYRFVDSAETLWDVQELRAWSAPTPLRVSAGQLMGGRTQGLTRTGNTVVTVGFGPLLQRRATLDAETSEAFLAIADTLGFGNAHPEILYVPALSARATLPEALDGETRYLLHFGTPDEADIVWAADASTGIDLDGIVPLAPGHLARLAAGHPLTLTAVKDTEPGAADALWAIELTSLNQAGAIQSLLGYMASQLPGDLATLIPPGGTETTAPAPPTPAPATPGAPSPAPNR